MTPGAAPSGTARADGLHSAERRPREEPAMRNDGARRGTGTRLVVRLLALALACGAGPSGVAGQPARARPAPPPPVVEVVDGHLTLDVRDAQLTDVLAEIAAAASFRLTTRGELGRVTARLDSAPLEDGLRRLVQDHELMLVYGRSADGTSRLVGVDVYAAPAGTRATTRLVPPAGSDAGQREAVLAEINQLSRQPDSAPALSRLEELLGTADPVVRAR